MDRLLQNTIENALLHLYCNIAATTQFVPVATRNSLLNKYLKSKVQEVQYKPIKKDLKLMLAIGRKRGSNLEAEMWKLIEITDPSDGEKLYSMLAGLYETHELASELVKDEELKSNVIYILPDHIDGGFDDSGRLMGPISLYLMSKKYFDRLTSIINDTGLFFAETKELNVDKYQVHLEIHPVTIP